jgi:pimeloyl-ACP methyl ester carboxylesterase
MDSDRIVVSTDGTHIAYDVTGEGKPVLLIHGFASSREQNWKSTGWVDRLVRENYRVVSFDLRGHGHSDKPYSPDAYGDRMIDDILVVMHASGIEDAFVMGYSMGAMLAIRFLMLHPERVRRVVAAGVGENYFGEQQAWQEKVAAAVLTEDPSTIADDEARRFRIFGGQRGKDRIALAACMRAPRHAYSPADLKASQRPVLVVAGENDPLVGSPVALAGAFADGRAVILPNKDHMTAVGDPAYKRAVLNFFAAGA